MKRRFFFQFLAALGLVGKAPAPSKPIATVPKCVLQRCPLRGYSHHQSPALLERLQVGTLLTLRAEPENPHDSHAVMVFWQHHLLGYLPRENNTHASSLLRGGLPLLAHITSLSPDHPWSPIGLEVFVGLAPPSSPSA